MPPIRDFYSDQTIFLTGVTGFLGKLILEKLLRSCYDLRKIYVLIRPKRNKTQIERLRSLLGQPCFQKLRHLHSDFADKIRVLNGDCSMPDLGLSPEDRIILQNEVTCVIHAAAIVKFDIDLRTAVYANLRSVRDLLALAKAMSKLKCFVYVSTAFSHCPRRSIAEEFYDVNVDPEELIVMVEKMNNQILSILTPGFLGKWPNTYVYSKALAEKLLSKPQNFPIAVLRPAIVASTSQEPLPGWIDNFQGLAGVVIGVSVGVLRTLNVDPNVKARIVPADYVVSNIIAAAWHVKEGGKIYHCTGSDSNSITWGEIMDGLMEFSHKYPLNEAVWYYHFSLTPHRLVHKVKAFLLHTLFAYFVDLILLALRKKPMAVRKYQKINKLVDSLAYFSLRSWNFSSRNSELLWEEMDDEDRKMFSFDMNNFRWKDYFEKCLIGGRIYLMKDPLETVPQAKKRIFFLAIVHYAFITFIFYLLFKICFSLVY